MKTINVCFILTIFLCFSVESNGINITRNYKMKTLNIQRQQSFIAYVQTPNDGWVKGSISITNGYVTDCNFPRTSAGLEARIYYGTNISPFPLNPNNPIAIQNNFTHFVDIAGYGRAYFTANKF
jgi:hypothetical protein